MLGYSNKNALKVSALQVSVATGTAREHYWCLTDTILLCNCNAAIAGLPKYCILMQYIAV